MAIKIGALGEECHRPEQIRTARAKTNVKRRQTVTVDEEWIPFNGPYEVR